MPAKTSAERPSGWRLPYLAPWLIAVVRLFRPREIWQARTGEKVVALTFDDGPSATYFAEVLDVLEREQVPATFFLIGDRLPATEDPGAEQRRANVKRAALGGHELAYHNWKHQSVGEQRDGSFTEDLNRFRRELGDLLPRETHRKVRFFRPPFGHMEAYVHRVMKNEGMRVVEAHVLPGDAYVFPGDFLEDERRAVERVLDEAQPGSVICLHVGEDLGREDKVYDAVNAAKIVAALIPRLRERGFRFARMSDLVPAR